MKVVYNTNTNTDHNCGPEGDPSCFPGGNPFFPFGNIADSGEKCEARYPFPGVPLTFPWYEIFPGSSNTLMEDLLNIPDIAVEKTEITGYGDVIITVRSTAEGTRCGKCGRSM